MSIHNAGTYRRKANPDDPPVQRPPSGPREPVPGPNFPGLEGRIAIVQAQVFLLAVILIAQLWLMVAVVLLTLQAFASNRLAGIPYPLWNPIKEKEGG